MPVCVRRGSLFLACFLWVAPILRLLPWLQVIPLLRLILGFLLVSIRV
jgi:hypothetical protein